MHFKHSDMVERGGAFRNLNQGLREELDQRGEPHETLRIGDDGAKHVQAYIDYDRVVGDSDGGRLLDEGEYERFLERAKEERGKNRLYCHVRNPEGLDCKAVGPQTQCVCNHRFREHTTDNMRNEQSHKKDVHCRYCQCPQFRALPAQSPAHARCSCKHEASSHNVRTGKCGKCKCTSFSPTQTCSCGYSARQHETVLETRQERLNDGRNVEPDWASDVPYEALGGLSDFRSLLSGVERLEVEGSQEHGSALGRLKERRRTAGRISGRNADEMPPSEPRTLAEERGVPGSQDELEQLHQIKGARSSRPPRHR